MGLFQHLHLFHICGHVLIVLSAEFRIVINIIHRWLKRSHMETLLVHREFCFMSSDVGNGDLLMFVWSTFVSNSPRAPDFFTTSLRFEVVIQDGPESLGLRDCFGGHACYDDYPFESEALCTYGVTRVISIFSVTETLVLQLLVAGDDDRAVAEHPVAVDKHQIYRLKVM